MDRPTHLDNCKLQVLSAAIRVMNLHLGTDFRLGTDLSLSPQLLAFYQRGQAKIVFSPWGLIYLVRECGGSLFNFVFDFPVVNTDQIEETVKTDT